MGGVAIVAAALVGYVVAHLRGGVIFTRSGLLVMAAIGGAGAVGLVDDWIKVTRERNLGLNKRAKILGLLVVAIGFAAARRVVHAGAHDAVVHPLQRSRSRARRARRGACSPCS